jgi:MFS family permease
MLGYFCAALDRANVGMAATTMNTDLGFSNAVFGFGAGMFFWGNLLAEIPSNLMLNKLGARIWFARILITWGFVSALTAFVWNEWSFYGIRFVLGLAEGGFMPGGVLFITWWFPSYYQSRARAIFLCSGAIGVIAGPPISGLLLQLNGILGLYGWQWIFVLEALPAIIMCFVIWQMLTDRPAQAGWLTPEQRTWLSERLSSERAQREAIHKFSLTEAFSNGKVWLLAMAWVGANASMFVLTFFLPLVVKGLGVSTNMIGVVSAVPFAFALVAMIYWSRHSDLTGERVWHIAGASLLCAVGLGASILIGTSHPLIIMVALILAGIGAWCTSPVFWSLPSALLSGTAAAGGIAMINAVGNLGGWLGPWVFGLIKDATGSDNVALCCLALAPLVTVIGVIAAGHDRRMEGNPRDL